MTEIHNIQRAPRQAGRLAQISGRPTGLLEAISEFVGKLPSPQLQPVAAADAPMSHQARALLAVLSFFYAQRVYPSHEIELALSQNQALRALCGQNYPTAHLLRRFRRYNRDLLRECLAYVLARLQSTQPGRDRIAEGTNRPAQANSDALRFSFLQEAEIHIDEAVLRDTVELD